MSEQKAPPRPRQVTTAGVMGVVGSALVVLSLFDALQRLRSVETREAVDTFLAEPPGDGLGVSTGWVLDAMHVVLLFSGALAAVAAVLAVYVFQRHQGARIGFSIAAALLLLTSPFSGGALAMVVAFAAAMLWSRPARDWFAGREPAPALSTSGDRWDDRGDRVGDGPAAGPTPGPTPGRTPAPSGSHDQPPAAPTGPYGPGSVPATPVPATPVSGDDRPPAASYPFGSRPDPHWAPPAFDQRPGTPAWVAGTARDPERRPASVAIAAVITWFFAGLAALMFLLVVLMLMFAQDTLVEAMRSDARFDDLNVSVDDLLAAVWVVSAVAVFWSVAALALAFLAFRRLGWARILLAVSAGMTCLVSLLAFPAGLLMLLPAGAVLVLLFTGGANDWYAHRSRPVPPPSGPYGGSGPGGTPYPGPQAPTQQQPQPHQPPQRPSGKPPVW
jgi:hypothetical protein